MKANIIVHDENNRPVVKQVNAKEISFANITGRFIIHREAKYGKHWAVSEYTTGYQAYEAPINSMNADNTIHFAGIFLKDKQGILAEAIKDRTGFLKQFNITVPVNT